MMLSNFLDGKPSKYPDLIRQCAEIPDVGNRNYQGKYAHAFTADLFFRYFNSATVANNTLISDSLVFSAMAFSNLLPDQKSVHKTNRHVRVCTFCN